MDALSISSPVTAAAPPAGASEPSARQVRNDAALWLSLAPACRGPDRGVAGYGTNEVELPLREFKALLLLAAVRTALGDVFVPHRRESIKPRETDVHRNWPGIVQRFPAFALAGGEHGLMDYRLKHQLLSKLQPLIGTRYRNDVLQPVMGACRLGRAIGAVEFDLDALLRAADPIVASLARTVADNS